jgi:hypothetical protein
MQGKTEGRREGWVGREIGDGEIGIDKRWAKRNQIREGGGGAGGRWHGGGGRWGVWEGQGQTPLR